MSKHLMLNIEDLSRANEYALDIARTSLVKESLRKVSLRNFFFGLWFDFQGK